MFKPRVDKNDKGVEEFTWDVLGIFTRESVMEDCDTNEDGVIWKGGMVELAYQALQGKFGLNAKFKDPPPPAVPQFESPFREKYEFKTQRPEYENMLMCTLKSKNRKPGIVYSDGKTPIENEKDFYPGCYVDAAVNAYAWAWGGNKGVSFGLRNIRKLKDGEPLSVFADAESDFKAASAKTKYGIDNSAMFQQGKANLAREI